MAMGTPAKTVAALRCPYNSSMSMTSPRFFCPLPLVSGACVDLPESAARHAARALRLGPGDAVVLFDGGGGEYACRIVEVTRRGVTVEVGEHSARECESPLQLTLVQALQSGDKMDFTVQKAVELGVAGIVPVLSRRSVLRLSGERAERRVEHWRGIVGAACEQSGRNRLPEVAAIVPLERWLAQPPAPGVCRLMLDPRAALSLSDLPRPPDGRVELLIGAEGGLAPEEMDLALLAGFVAVRLGPRVLRTETAGMAALAALQSLWGDFRGSPGGEARHV